MRPETFKTETETCKNGLETKSQDFITKNNPTKLLNQKSCKICWISKIAVFLWSDNFSWLPTANARRPIKGSKDADLYFFLKKQKIVL